MKKEKKKVGLPYIQSNNKQDFKFHLTIRKREKGDGNVIVLISESDYFCRF